MAGTLTSLAWARALSGDLVGARVRFAEALAIYKSTGAQRSVLDVTWNLAGMEFQGGDAAMALRLAGEALAACRAANLRLELPIVSHNMTSYLVALGRYGEAHSLAREALAAEPR